MGEVTSFTADRIQAIEDAEITGYSTDASGRVTLNRKDGGTIQLPSVNFPTGAVMMFASAVVPTGWLLCNGQAVSRTTYASLYAVIGTVYGSGNGSTTFNVPNLEAKFPRMQAAGLGQTGGGASHNHVVPDHTHSINQHDHDLNGGSVQAHAQVRLFTGAGPNLHMNRISVPTYTSNFGGDSPNSASESDSQNTGSKVAGMTALDGNDTNSSGGSTTGDSSSPLPPYVNVNFVIKI